ncbi:PRD domain-containing protein [Mollicutes bacterium LVI A0039]|nr:PRD domain-containing protein [Mollicutes bacterium LVI A0039]
MTRDDKVRDKLLMLVNGGELDKSNMTKALDIYEWLKTEYPDAHISSMMISHIALTFQRVLKGEQISDSDVEYKMPLSQDEIMARNAIIKRIRLSVRKDISDAEINYLDIHIRNFIYDNL